MARLTSRSKVKVERVYDITVENTHSFFACSGEEPEKGVLAHNCHQLSRDALDALLKPLEENMKGSEDKKLVCIFCTTEPEKMRATILSRCAPAFVIHPLSPEIISKRLAYVCDQEGLEYEDDVLPLIAEITECHIRDALKAIEGVSMLGGINKENVNKYLHLDLNDLFLDVIEHLSTDLDKSMQALKGLLQRTSPSTCYERLANVALFAYKVSRGLSNPPVYWDKEKLEGIGKKYGNTLISLVSLFTSKPRTVTEDMLICDLISQHLFMNGQLSVPQPMHLSSVAKGVVEVSPTKNNSKNSEDSVQLKENDCIKDNRETLKDPVEISGIHIDHRAVSKDSIGHNENGIKKKGISPIEFGRLLDKYLLEITGGV